MSWNRVRHLALGITLVALVGLAGACKSDSTGPPAATTGSAHITTTTTGADLDVDGYQIAVDGGAAQAIGANTTVTVGNLTAASHSVTLSGLTANCTVSGTNPRSVGVTAGATVDVSFDVACVSTVGNIEVAVNATGANLPVLNNVTIDGTLQNITVVTGGSFTYSPYDVGDHTVEIEVAPNCTLTNPNLRTVTVPSGSTIQTVTTTYDLTCS